MFRGVFPHKPRIGPRSPPDLYSLAQLNVTMGSNQPKQSFENLRSRMLTTLVFEWHPWTVHVCLQVHVQLSPLSSCKQFLVLDSIGHILWHKTNIGMWDAVKISTDLKYWYWVSSCIARSWGIIWKLNCPIYSPTLTC